MAAALDAQMARGTERSVFCVDSWPRWLEQGTIESSCHAVAAFDKSGSFVRWLFAQPRGLGTPQSLLLCGWREAKPCADAMLAAISGETASLRPDNKRPLLMPVRQGAGGVPVAIHRIIVLVERNRKCAASEWARKHLTIQVSIVSTMRELAKALAPPEEKTVEASAKASEAKATAPRGLFETLKMPVRASEAKTTTPMGLFETLKMPVSASEAKATAPMGLFETLKMPVRASEAKATVGLFRPPPGLPLPGDVFEALAAVYLAEGLEAKGKEAPCYVKPSGSALPKAPGLELVDSPNMTAPPVSFPHAPPSSLFWF